MKNKQILFILLSIASCSLDASFFNWKFPKFNLSQYIRSFRQKEPSLDELVNKELDRTMKETALIPRMTHTYPESFYQTRHNSCREMYIKTLLEECEKLQNDENFKNKPTLIHKTAVEKANLAHQEIYGNFDKIWDAVIKTAHEENKKKISSILLKTSPKPKPLAPNVYIDPRLLALLIHESQEPIDHGYTKIGNQRSRDKEKIAYDQSKPHKLGGEQTKTPDEIKQSWASRFEPKQ